MIQLYNGDCGELLRSLDSGSVTTVFADPPDNLGLDYASYKDKMEAARYYDWLELLILESMRVAKTVWFSYYWAHDVELKYRIRRILKLRHPSWEAKPFVWTYTFGQHNAHDFGSCFRPVIRLRAPGVVTDVVPIMVESERQRLGDARANPDGRVPGDVFDFPRVVGNSHERRSFHPTQHPEKLIERILKSSGPYGRFVDLFVGSGTSAIVCKRLGIDFLGSELDPIYCQKIRELTGCENYNLV